MNTIIPLVKSKNINKGVTLLDLTTLIKAITVVKEKYIKIIGKNLYLFATIMSLRIIRNNIITQE